eukprot:gb/GECH01000160.1/.p1 GENE.gb/GECH01000160.1/~~gb/GECH01000160.1/.p1  ORF type:complete len:276 (+),score=43.55 gb/GECH01000160.1/:1-828(+)
MNNDIPFHQGNVGDPNHAFRVLPSFLPPYNRYVQCLVFYASLATVVYTALPFLLRRLFPAPSRLKPYEHTEWVSRLLSTVNAVVSVGLGAVVLYQDPHLYHHPVFGESRIGTITLSILAGYLLVDLVLTLQMAIHISAGYSTCIHHLVGLVASYLGVGHQFGVFYMLLFDLTEISTIFLNIRWFLAVLQYRKHQIYHLNNIILFVVFGLSRVILMIPFVMWHFYYLRFWEPLRSHVAAGSLLLAMPAFFSALNMMWFHRMCRLFVKAVQAVQKKS